MKMQTLKESCGVLTSRGAMHPSSPIDKIPSLFARQKNKK
jgi:hypothetical protein